MPKDNLKELIGSTGKKIYRDRQDSEISQSEVIRKVKSGKNVYKQLKLFISYDVVNSTAYKDMDGEWPNLLLGMFHEIEKRFDFFEANRIWPVQLWRIIGDEIIFTTEVRSEDMIDRTREALLLPAAWKTVLAI